MQNIKKIQKQMSEIRKTEKERNNDNCSLTKIKREKNRKQIQISVKSVWKGCQMPMESRIWKKNSFEVGKEEWWGYGWQEWWWWHWWAETIM